MKITYLVRDSYAIQPFAPSFISFSGGAGGAWYCGSCGIGDKKQSSYDTHRRVGIGGARGHGTVDPAELATKSNRPMILIGG